MQILYQIESKTKTDLYEVQEDLWQSEIDHFFVHFESKADVYDFTCQLVKETLAHLKTIDPVLQKHSPNWKIERMNAVDRNIARMAIYELFYEKKTPTKVILDEAIEIAKRFGSEHSGAFMNGILDPIAHEIRHV